MKENKGKYLEKILIGVAMLCFFVLIAVPVKIKAAETLTSAGASKESATKLQYSTNGYYAVRSGSDEDWYCFQASSTGYTNIYFKNAGMNDYAEVDLVSSIDEKIDSEKYVPNNDDAYISLKLEEGQIYYIKISGGTEGKTYILHLELNADEDGDTAALGTPINCNQKYTKTLDGYNDTDCLLFTADTAGSYNISVRNNNIDYSMDVAVRNYNTDERLWYANYVNYDETAETTLELEKGQKYYVCVGGCQNHYGSYTVCVNNQVVKSISLSKSVLPLLQGKSEKLTASVTPSTAYNTDVIWKSSNTSAAYVEEDGTVYGRYTGTTVITCTAADGKGVYAQCRVVVLPDQVDYLQSLSDRCTEKKVVLDWQSVDGVSGYGIFCYDTKKKTWSLVKTVNSKTTTTAITKVKVNGKTVSVTPGTTYKFYAAGYVSGGSTKYYGTKSVKTAASTCPSKVTALIKVKAASNGYATYFSWKKVKQASGYIIYLRNSYSGEYEQFARVEGGKKQSCKCTSWYYDSYKGRTFRIAAYRIVDGKTYIGAMSKAKTAK